MKVIKSIDDINVINDLLQAGETFESLSEREDFSSVRTIQRHLKKLGFKFNQKTRLLEPIEDVIEVTPDVTTDNTEVTQSVIQEDNTTVTLDNILKRIENLENMLHNNTNVTPIKITSNDDIITRSIKVSKDVMSQFVELCEAKFPMYNKQDILSTALLEFIEKYK